MYPTYQIYPIYHNNNKTKINHKSLSNSTNNKSNKIKKQINNKMVQILNQFKKCNKNNYNLKKINLASKKLLMIQPPISEWKHPKYPLRAVQTSKISFLIKI
jgi:hypothetical protein